MKKYNWNELKDIIRYGFEEYFLNDDKTFEKQEIEEKKISKILLSADLYNYNVKEIIFEVAGELGAEEYIAKRVFCNIYMLMFKEDAIGCDIITDYGGDEVHIIDCNNIDDVFSFVDWLCESELFLSYDDVNDDEKEFVDKSLEYFGFTKEGINNIWIALGTNCHGFYMY